MGKKKAVDLKIWETKRSFILEQVEAIKEIDTTGFDFHRREHYADLKGRYDTKARDYNELMEFLYKADRMGWLDVEDAEPNKEE